MIEWLSTAPNPRYIGKTHGADQGQRGWKLHAIAISSGTTLLDIKHRRAVCGLLPGTGWGVDLFIEDRCKRCEARLLKFPNIGKGQT